MKKHLEGLLQHAIIEARKGGALKSTSLPPFVLEIPKDRAFGDVATPIAMALARAERRPPREIAEAILAHMGDPQGWIASAEIAGPGYLNFRLSQRFWERCLRDVELPDFGLPSLGGGARVLVEFVSGNPTGPLHVGHGRGAVTGDVVARLLEAAGFAVEREYYINDAGRQVELLGRSICARLRQHCGAAVSLPDDGYQGEYISEVARRDADEIVRAVAAAVGAPPPAGDEARRAFLAAHEDAAGAVCTEHGIAAMMESIKQDLACCGIHFDNFVSERALRDSDVIGAALRDIEARGFVYESEGARWFRSSLFGDEKDRVLVRSNGELTYFASDVGYHRDKLLRGFGRLIDVWGADHHGYIARVRASIQALGFDPAAFQVLLVQIVNLTRSGQPVRMGKRHGEFVALRDVVEEVGPDAARFFFLMRKADSQLDFDLDLAKKQGADNPVFYVQYAHARCRSLFRQAAAAGAAVPASEDANLVALSSPEEIELIKELAQFPDVVEEAAAQLEPHRIVFHLIELAGAFHRFYNRHRILGEDAALSGARLYLVRAVQQTVRRGLGILGVAAPESM